MSHSAAPPETFLSRGNEFLPISMPITAIALCAVAHIGVLLVLAPWASLSLAGREHGRTVLLPDILPNSYRGQKQK